MQNLVGFLFGFLLFFDSRILVPASSQSESIKHGKHVALFVFGDSLYDPGNNNFINTSHRCDFPPYGETYFKFPTGRCSDGRLIPDFIAMDAKLPLWKPFLGPGKHQFTNGANFASAGAGVLPVTHPGTLNLETQLISFKEVASLLRQQPAGEKLLRNAVSLFDIGGVDYTCFNSEYPNSTELVKQVFVNWVIGNMTDVVKEMYNLGARKFAFQNIAPLGCLPVIKQKYNLKENECLEALMELPILHNDGLFKAAKELETQLSDFKFLIFDFHSALLERINNPLKYGFKEAGRACCGSGILSAADCGIGEYELCSTPNEYLFFDGNHPTEPGQYQFAQLLWDGGEMNATAPLSLKQLFEIEIEPETASISGDNYIELDERIRNVAKFSPHDGKHVIN